jgi:hypothetical protein
VSAGPFWRRCRAVLVDRLLFWLGASPPWLRQWLAQLADEHAGQPTISYIAEDSIGQRSLVEQLADVPPGGRVIVPAYAVAVTFKLSGGRLMFWSLTELMFTPAAVEAKQRQLLRRFPKSSIVHALLAYNPRDKAQRAELDECHRRMVAEMMRAR